eukprot:1194823-Prorocentrum_minimum.AAC.3
MRAGVWNCDCATGGVHTPLRIQWWCHEISVPRNSPPQRRQSSSLAHERNKRFPEDTPSQRRRSRTCDKVIVNTTLRQQTATRSQEQASAQQAQHGHMYAYSRITDWASGVRFPPPSCLATSITFCELCIMRIRHLSRQRVSSIGRMSGSGSSEEVTNACIPLFACVTTFATLRNDVLRGL